MAKPVARKVRKKERKNVAFGVAHIKSCLLYTSDAADE